MTLAFTLCSVNYLAQAKTLAESIKRHNPEVKFIVGLVDTLIDKDLDLEKISDIELLEVSKIDIQDFKAMCTRYNITELNTAVKPYFIDYFWKKYPEVENLFYFDPDIIIYASLSSLIENLKKADFVLTPHTWSSYDDNLWQNEEDLNNSGIYNLGFIGLKRSENSLAFTKWWMNKLAYECTIDLANGLFVDQHWVDFLHIYWSNVYVENSKGYNVAYWNLHERPIALKNEKWTAAGDDLVFFHYSGYLIAKPHEVSKYQNRISFENRPDIKPLFEYYYQRLLENHQTYFEAFPCAYLKKKKAERLVRVRKYATWPLRFISDLILKV